MAIGTHNGKSRQGGASTGNDWARKNKNPSLLEAKGWQRQMEDLRQS
jgi:hypothetical protein